MLISFVRTLILYFALIFAVRLMGKRQLGQLEPTEFVVTMLIADLASVPMQNEGTPLLAGLIPILVVLSVELLLSVWVYNSIPVRRFFCGKPVIVIEQGRLVQENLRKTRLNVDELTEQLRLQGITDLATVQFAILETSGNLSALLYPKFEPASARDVGISVPEQALPYTLVCDGTLLEENLQRSGLSRLWLQKQLDSHNCRLEDVFLLTAEPSGKLYLSIREGTK